MNARFLVFLLVIKLLLMNLVDVLDDKNLNDTRGQAY